mgnify:CR=1 FL=1
MMKWLDKLARKIERFAVANLMQYVALTMAVFLIFSVIQPGVPLLSLIQLSPYRIMQGQVWRLVTFIFDPPSSGLFAFLVIYFYYWMGQQLEYYWGTAKFNLYYLFGMIGAIIAAFIAGYGSSTYLNLSLFLAYASLFPDSEVLLFFIFPMKMKYLAWFELGLLAWMFLLGNLATRMAILFSLLNFLLFFGPKVYDRIKNRMRYRKFKNQFGPNNFR